MRANLLYSFAPLLLCCLLAGCSSKPGPAEARRAEAPAGVKIVHFYASPGVVAAGGAVTLCYGVQNAASVRLDPAVEAIAPSPNRCIQFTPARTRTYTLIAAGADGSEASESLAIRVGPRAVDPTPRAKPAANRLIETFAASAEQVSPGQPVTLCYVVRGATNVRIEPPAGELAPGDRHCTVVRPASTVTYTLIATADGREDREPLTVQVK